MTNDRIGIDLGGTKIEGVLMRPDGSIARRWRQPTPKGDYHGILQAIANIIGELEPPDQRLNVGLSTPGSISARTGLMRNSNSVCLNGKPVSEDLQKLLGRRLRFANDANCLALSEATDGAAAGADVVFAVIIGTGCGGGICAGGRALNGINGIAGEWGHIPLPWQTAEEFPGAQCYCGKRGCNETFISGTGLEADYQQTTGNMLSATEIATLAKEGNEKAEATLARYENRLARALALVANFLDPDVIVLGGGISNLTRLYDNLPPLIHPHIFGGDFTTPIRQAAHGDSSGVRGAAWLWSSTDPSPHKLSNQQTGNNQNNLQKMIPPPKNNPTTQKLTGNITSGSIKND